MWMWMVEFVPLCHPSHQMAQWELAEFIVMKYWLEWYLVISTEMFQSAPHCWAMLYLLYNDQLDLGYQTSVMRNWNMNNTTLHGDGYYITHRLLFSSQHFTETISLNNSHHLSLFESWKVLSWHKRTMAGTIMSHVCVAYVWAVSTYLVLGAAGGVIACKISGVVHDTSGICN